MTTKKNALNCTKIMCITAIVTFLIVLVINLAFLYNATIEGATIVLGISRTISIVLCFFSSLAVLSFLPKTQKLSHYFTRFYITIILLILMSVAVSFGGGLIVNGFVGGVRSGMDNPFLRGAILKIPLLIMYLVYIYTSFQKFGFIDSQKREFSLPLKAMAVVYSFLFMLSDTIYDSMFNNYSVNALSANLHTVFNPNIDLYADRYTVSSNFSIIGVIIGIVLVLAIEAGIATYAYNRGKRRFVKEHLKSGDYETYLAKATKVSVEM